MDAVVLVGGFGTRLRPLTLTVPKNLVPVAGVPLIERVVAHLAHHRIDRVVLSLGYRPDSFFAAFPANTAAGIPLTYVVEPEPLGTGGAIGFAARSIERGRVLVCNGDVLTDLDISHLLRFHEERGAVATIALTPVEDPSRYGLVRRDADTGAVRGFLEKPSPEEIDTNLVNAGTYVFSRPVVESIPSGRPVSVEHETFPGLLAAGARVIGYLDASYWRDLGKPADFVAGSADLVRGIAPTEALPGPTGEALVLPGAKVADGAILTGGCTVGRDCVIEAGAVIDGSVLFDGVRVAGGASIRDSIVGRNASVGAGTVLDTVVIGDRAVLGAGIELLAGARVWPDVRLPDGCVRFSADS